MPSRIPVPESRLKSVFPPGFDTKSSGASRRGHYTFDPEQLSNAIIDIPNKHVESIIVKSAWYGKQTKSAEHEFILLQVEDMAVKGLINYLILDRNAGDPSEAPPGIMTHSRVSFQGAMAKDTFRVSYNGIEKQLLDECQLRPYKYLEKIEFLPHEQLYLYELVTLADMVSKQYPYYHPIESNCYMFAGLIWECMLKLRPSAIYQGDLAVKRGQFGWVRYIPSAPKIDGVYQAIMTKIPEVQATLGNLNSKTPLESNTSERVTAELSEVDSSSVSVMMPDCEELCMTTTPPTAADLPAPTRRAWLLDGSPLRALRMFW